MLSYQTHGENLSQLPREEVRTIMAGVEPFFVLLCGLFVCCSRDVDLLVAGDPVIARRTRSHDWLFGSLRRGWDGL